MSEELKTLKTVYDVLRWAFDYLGIEKVCGDECNCDSNTMNCGEIPECNIAKRYPCDGDKCEHSCWTDYDAEYCVRDMEIVVPVKPEWTTKLPSKPGLYVYFVEEIKNYTVVKITRMNDCLVLENEFGVIPLDSNAVQEWFNKYKPIWFKIEEPDMQD